MLATKTTAKASKQQMITLGIASVFLLLAVVMPGFGPLNAEMVKTICLIVFAIILWVTTPIPILATSFLVLAFQPILGLVPSLNAALTGFSNPANYFTIASFGFAFALQKTTLSNRLLKNLVDHSKGSIPLIALSLMVVTYIVSMFISDIAASVIMLAFATDLASLVENDTERKTVLKLLLIGVPIGSILGGAATPVGSSINVMALNIMHQYSGLQVPFMHWVVVCMPVTALMLVIGWFVLTRFFKTSKLSEPVTHEFSQNLQSSIENIETPNEPVIIIVLIATILLWIVSSWIDFLDSTIVALISLGVMFSPWVSAFTWSEFKSKMSWEIPVMGATTISLGTLAVNSGLIGLVVEKVTQTLGGTSMAGMVLVIGTLVSVLLIAIPVGPTMVSMLTIPSILMAQAFGLNPVIIVMILGMFASNSTILPLNATMLVSFSKGHWKTSDLAPIGVIISILWISLATLWTPVVSLFLN